MTYKTICRAILKKNGYDEKAKKMMTKWIMLFEETKVPRFSRDKFFDDMIECKKELEE